MEAAAGLVWAGWAVGPGLFLGPAAVLLVMALAHALHRRRPSLARVALGLIGGAALGAGVEVLAGPVAACLGDGAAAGGTCPSGLSEGWPVLLDTVVPGLILALALALPGRLHGRRGWGRRRGGAILGPVLRRELEMSYRGRFDGDDDGDGDGGGDGGGGD